MYRYLSLVYILILLTSTSTYAQKTTLRYATIGEPPSLDQQVLTSDLATTIGQHLFEGLYTFNSSYVPVPMLAEREEIKNNGKSIDILIRKNVNFHNGKKMTSKDVVDSLNRWGEYGSRGRLFFDNVESIQVIEKFKVRITFKKVFGPWKNLLAFINGGPVIYPSEIVANASKKPIDIKNYIGTGPYKIGSWKANRFLEIVKFDNYSPRKEKSDGYGGIRKAFFKKIQFIPVSDVMTRISGVQSGDYDYAEQIPGDLFVQLKNDSSVKVIINQGAIFGLIFINSKHGLLKDNYALRRAILTAIDMKPALKAAIGDPQLWQNNSSFMPKTSFWYSKAGSQFYSQGNSKKAKKLAQEAGYKGETINFIVSKNYIHHYDTAAVIVEQLSKAGFQIDLKIYDWATLISKRSNPTQWDMFFTHHGFVPDPILISAMDDSYPGWWKSKKKNQLKNAFVNTTDQIKRKEIWNQMQSLIYLEVPAMKTGDIFTYNIASPKLKGIKSSSLIWPKFWGVSK